MKALLPNSTGSYSGSLARRGSRGLGSISSTVRSRTPSLPGAIPSTPPSLLRRGFCKDGLAGVLSHELGHIKHRDTLTMTITATLAGALSMLANFGFYFGGRRNTHRGVGPIGGLLLLILGPLAAGLVQMGISRGREYEADRIGAEISKRPLSLASALRKISSAVEQIPNPTAERNPASAPLFIINPLSGVGMDNLFSTHPNVENRIARLNEIARQMGQLGFGTPRN